MATYYWYGGTGTWDSVDSTHWSTAPNGTGLPGVPSSIDNVVFDQVATYSVFCGSGEGTANCLNLTISAGTVTLRQGSDLCQVHGSLNIINSPTSDLSITFAGSASRTIQTNGTQFLGADFQGGTVQLLGPLTLSSTLSVQSAGTLLDTNGYSITAGSINQGGAGINFSTSTTLTGSFTLTSGTLNLNGTTLTCASFNSNGAGARTIAFGSTGGIVTTGSSVVWDTTTGTGLTTTGSKTVTISNNTAAAASILGGSVAAGAVCNFNVINGTYALTATGNLGDLILTGFGGSLAAGARSIYGNLTLSSSAGFSATGGTAVTIFTATSSKTITCNGKNFDVAITFNGVGGSWLLADSLTQVTATRDVTLTNGTINLNGQNFTFGRFSTATGTKSITFNGGKLICIGSGASAFNNSVPTNFSTTAGTGAGEIRMSSTTAKTFSGGGSTFNCNLVQAGTGTLTINGANTIDTLSNTVAPCTIIFASSNNHRFNNFNLVGTSGSPVTLNPSVTATNYTLIKQTGTGIVSTCNYLNISYSTASPATNPSPPPAAVWYAGANSLNIIGNSGWVFTAAPVVATNTGAFFSVF